MNLEQHSNEIFIFYDIVFERHANSFGIMTESANEYNLRFLKTDLTHIHCCVPKDYEFMIYEALAASPRLKLATRAT